MTDAIDPRVPPHSEEAEHALLGAMLLSEEAARKALTLVVPDDFYRNGNAQFFNALAACVYEGHGCDVLSVVHECERREIMESIGGRDYLGRLVRSVSTPNNVEQYARIVREKSISRQIIREGMTLQQRGWAEEDPVRVWQEHAAQAGRLAQAASGSKVDGQPLVWKGESEMNDESAEVAWILKGLLAKGQVAMLVAQPKAGKSTWTYGAIAALERGESFCGLATTASTAVVMSEEHVSSIAQKVRRFGVKRAVFLDRSQAFPPRPLRQIVEEAVRKAHEVGASLLVVDTFAVWAHMPADAEKDAGAAQAALAPLQWAATQGLAVLIVHHMKKADGDDGTSVRGSSALLATVDVLIELRRFGKGDDDEDPFTRGGSNQRSLRSMSRFDETPEEVIVNLDRNGYAAQGTATQARMGKMVEKVVAFVCEAARWVTTGEIQTGVGGRKQAVLIALKQAVSANRVARKPVGKGFAFAPVGTQE